MARRPIVLSLAVAAVAATWAGSARAQPSSVNVVRLLGDRALRSFAPPGAPAMGGIVRLPAGVRGADLGLGELAPGFARLWGSPSAIVAFAGAHPGLAVEVSPPLRALLDTAAGYVGATAAQAAGHEGAGALVGIADTGVDVMHADFIDANGNSRVEWLLDLSSVPRGVHADLESQYGTYDTSGNLVLGAVWSKDDIQALLAPDSIGAPPIDEVGHGTLVAACAAGRDARYQGVAPQAGLVVARISGPAEGIANDDMLRGVQFLFDRADAMARPIAVNLSIGTDFGPHDGTLAWEQVLASHVGASQPGHALIVAAGNSGSIAEVPVHENVYVAPGSTVRVPFLTIAANDDSTIGVWVAMHAGADLSVGVDASYGTWVPPVPSGASDGRDAKGFAAGAAVDNDSGSQTSMVPAGSHGAIVMMQGTWPEGAYYVTLTGSGTADLYIEGVGDVGNLGNVGFASGVREGTINIPATHPDIISVGCTINKKSWVSEEGVRYGLQEPVLDSAGGQPLAVPETIPIEGEPCWFSSAGPNLLGQPKPEIMAPGAAIIGALSAHAVPPVPTSIFSFECPESSSGPEDPSCQVIDTTHAVSFGTSFSAPLVTGAVAVLFERDPTLTQAEVVAALQGGAHRLRGTAPFFDDDQSGPGELDVVGSLAVVDRLSDPELALPVLSQSWMSVGTDMYLADGSTPVTAIFELRTSAVGDAAPLPADGFGDGRLATYVLVDGAPFGTPPPIQRSAPGVGLSKVSLPAGLGGSSLTVGATFDGADIVPPKSIPIATDFWNAEYPPSVRGGCSVAVIAGETPAGPPIVALGLALGVACASRRRGRRQGERRETPRGGPRLSRNRGRKPL